MDLEELWSVVRARGRTALASGALQPTPTRLYEVEDAGVVFAVRVLDGHDAKRASAHERDRSRRDPFLPPYDPDLFVADLSPTHVALLNKFNVLEDHLLILGRDSDPSIAHREQNGVTDSLRLERDILALGPEFYRVRQQVDQHLLDLALVSDHFFDLGSDLALEPDPAPQGAFLHQHHRVLDGRGEMELRELEFDSAGPDFAQVEDVTDLREPHLRSI